MMRRWASDRKMTLLWSAHPLIPSISKDYHSVPWFQSDYILHSYQAKMMRQPNFKGFMMILRGLSGVKKPAMICYYVSIFRRREVPWCGMLTDSTTGVSWGLHNRARLSEPSLRPAWRRLGGGMEGSRQSRSRMGSVCAHVQISQREKSFLAFERITQINPQIYC